MNANNIQVKCEQWQITATDDMNEVNFFGGTAKFKLNEIDLMQYCIDDSFPISSKSEDVDISPDNASLELYQNYGNITLRLSNIKFTNIAQDFFRIYDDLYLLNTAPYIRYKIRVLVNGVLKFQGVFNTFDLKYAMSNEMKSRKTIDLPVYSWDKEFEDYYSNKKMQDLSSLGSPVNNIWESSIISPYYGTLTFDNCSISNMFTYSYKISPSTIQVDSGINNDRSLAHWRISRLPQLITGFNSYNAPIYFFATGYDYVRDNLNYSMFDFLKYMCNGMGWIFYWQIVSDEMKLIIRNRVTSLSYDTPIRLDANKLIEYGVEFTEHTVPVSTIKMSVVELTGGGEAFEGLNSATFSGDANVLKGAGDLVFTGDGNLSEPSKDLLFFNRIMVNSSPELIVDWDNNYIHSRYSDNNADKQRFIDFANVTVGSTIRSTTVSNDSYFNVDDILHIKAGDNFFNLAKKRRVDLSNNVRTDYESGDTISDRDLIFAGNICTAMFYTGTATPIPYLSVNNNEDNRVESYYQSEQLEKNMRALLSNITSTIIDLEISGIFDIGTTVEEFENISGIEDEDLFSSTVTLGGTTWTYDFPIVSREVDYISETTKLKIKKRLIEVV